MSDPKKLTVKEAAARAGVSPSVVYLWCEDRRLAHYRLGGRGRRKVLIDPADLDALLASFKVEAVPGGAADVPSRHL